MHRLREEWGMPHRTLTMFTGLVLAMGTGVSTARGQCEANEFDRLVASDGEEYDMFGRSVAVFGDFAMVGAPEDDDNGEDAGSVYVYRLDGTTWIEEAKLTASDGAPEDYFGMPLAMSGNVAIVGAGGDDDNGSESGSVYVFRFNGEDWVEEAKLLPTDGPTYGPFGGPLAVAGDVALIGAYRDDDNG